METFYARCEELARRDTAAAVDVAPPAARREDDLDAARAATAATVERLLRGIVERPATEEGARMYRLPRPEADPPADDLLDQAADNPAG
jgi:hypothetical protein